MLARLPGLALAAAVALVAYGLAAAERNVFGSALIDALVLAIILGAIVRAVTPRTSRFEAGVDFAAKELLEVAVCLLGASVDLDALASAGIALAVGIVVVVAAALATSYAIGRAFQLSRTHALLVACGNAICGNSAIAAIAPVIKAEREEIASAISFTAILGVFVVIGLPLLIGPLGLSSGEYGVLAGLTIYSVPQVLAAAYPVGAHAGQIATLVKLVRVLMLGPIVLFFTVRARRELEPAPVRVAGLVPWFIVGFVAFATVRAFGWFSAGSLSSIDWAARTLTLIAMAALGLGVDFAAVRQAGRRVTLTVLASLAALVGLSLALLRVLPTL